jgi:hypothetical protein
VKLGKSIHLRDLSCEHFITHARLALQANLSAWRTRFTFRYADPKRMKVKQRGLSGWQQLSLRALSLLAALMFVLAGSLVLRGTAHTQSATITVDSSAHLVNQLVLDVSGTDFCSTPPGTTAEVFGGGVTVFQKTGRGITSASAGITPTCDGVVHTYQVEMISAFHGGPAIAHATFSIEHCLGGVVLPATIHEPS